MRLYNALKHSNNFKYCGIKYKSRSNFERGGRYLVFNRDTMRSERLSRNIIVKPIIRVMGVIA